jgi:hypothetical protein
MFQHRDTLQAAALSAAFYFPLLLFLFFLFLFFLFLGFLQPLSGITDTVLYRQQPALIRTNTATYLQPPF